eukprot:949555_1
MAITELFQTHQTHQITDETHETHETEINENILHIEKSTKKDPSPKPKLKQQIPPIEADKYFDPSELYISKIRVNSAIWGYNLDTDDEKSTDITTRIQQYVNYLGDTRLILPSRKLWRLSPFKDDIFRTDPDPKQPEDKLECIIKYDIIRSIYDPIINDIRCDILKTRILHITNNNELKIEAKPSTFDRVVE